MIHAYRDRVAAEGGESSRAREELEMMPRRHGCIHLCHSLSFLFPSKENLSTEDLKFGTEISNNDKSLNKTNLLIWVAAERGSTIKDGEVEGGKICLLHKHEDLS